MPSKKPVTKNKSTVYVIGGAVIVLLIGAYLYSSHNIDNRIKPESTQIHHPANKEDLSQYEHSLIGDNNAVINIIGILPGSEYIDKIELSTEQEPYGIKLHGTDSLTGKQIEAISSQLLKLIDNCDWVEIDTDEFHSRVTRDGLEAFSVIN